MILYNVTVKIELDANDEWVQWMKAEHIPDVLKTGLFVDNRFCRLLSVPEDDGITYSIQYVLKDMATYEKYQSEFAPALQKETQEKFKDKFVSFRTIMEIL